MRTRKVLAMAVVATLALVAGACSGDDEAAEDTTTTTETGTDEGAEGAETDQDPQENPAEQELTDDEFIAQVETLRRQIDAAGTDVCQLIEAQSTGTLANPANATQGQMTVELFADVMRKMADAADEAGKGDSAAVMRDAADQLVAEGEAAGYSDEYLSQTPAALNSEEVQAAQNDFIELAAECEPVGAPAG